MNSSFFEFKHIDFFPECVNNQFVDAPINGSELGSTQITSSTLGTTKLAVPFWWLMRGMSYSVDWELKNFRSVGSEEGEDFSDTYSLSFPPSDESSQGNNIWSMSPRDKICQGNAHFLSKSDAGFNPPAAYMEMKPFVEIVGQDRIYKLHLHTEALYEEEVASSSNYVFVSSSNTLPYDFGNYSEGIVLHQQTLEIPENPYNLSGSFNATFAWFTQGYLADLTANFYDFKIDWWHPPVPE